MAKTKIENKLFIVRKYVMARSVIDAVKKERKMPVDDCWVDDDWKKNNPKVEDKKDIGFRINK